MARGKRKPKSSEHIHGRRKTWLSEGNVTDGRMDLSPRVGGRPWWKSPLMKEARLKKAATLRVIPDEPAPDPLTLDQQRGL